MSTNRHLAAIRDGAYWIRSRYSGHKSLGEWATDIEQHAEALAAAVSLYKTKSEAAESMIAAYDYLMLCFMEAVKEPYGPQLQEALMEWRKEKRRYDVARYEASK